MSDIKDIETVMGRVLAHALDVEGKLSRASELAETEARSREAAIAALDKLASVEQLGKMFGEFRTALNEEAAARFDAAHALRQELELSAGKLDTFRGASSTAFNVSEHLQACEASGTGVAAAMREMLAYATTLKEVAEQCVELVQAPSVAAHKAEAFIRGGNGAGR